MFLRGAGRAERHVRCGAERMRGVPRMNPGVAPPILRPPGRWPAALCAACAAVIVAAVELLVGQRPSEGRPVR